MDKLEMLEKESEKIWDLFSEGKISHEEVQKRLDVLIREYGFDGYLPQPQSFFKRLKQEINERLYEEIPLNSGFRDREDVYINRMLTVETEIVKKSSFVKFWLTSTWLTYPTQQDLETIKTLDSEDLTEFHILIFRCLIDLSKQDLEDSETCKKLHAYYKLTKEEMVKRGILTNPQDAFLEYTQNKHIHIEEENVFEKARTSGSMCPYCKSENVGSYNREQWYCRSCQKRWRKH
jgi:hypothetical protein